MSPIRPTACRWCKGPIQHPAGVGRPRAYCAEACATAHHNWERRRERALDRGEAPNQLDVFGALPLAASHGRRPASRPSDGELGRPRRQTVVDQKAARHG